MRDQDIINAPDPSPSIQVGMRFLIEGPLGWLVKLLMLVRLVRLGIDGQIRVPPGWSFDPDEQH